ncbi:PREDICTED: uncharacterized protein LOC18598991 isoform X1 [Theobroma cacao]|uniref:Uncharacterized protein LOC18598991 isoform X1 n=1 Tax=Theobroma cacao TaxID=3641 RepID=A0AB32V4N6_THECC|nr:PREDICTED: uncharacterized protein LOC18598991 isoform X1 [Theobroma cacao]
MMMSSKPLKKTNSCPLKYKAPSMDQPSPHQVAFPTSPQAPQLGEEIFYFAHPQHPISQTNLPDLFTCAACKEYGAGERFTCSDCDYQLHDFCALAPPALKRHPIHPVHKIIFFPKPVKSGILKSRCDVCAKTTKGCVFKCTVCSFQMHPCCAMLSTEINIPVHPHTLRLLPVPQYTSNGDPGFVCGECNKRRSGRVYHCTVCDYHLHAVCAKNMVNGLQANGFKGMEKSSMLGAAAKVASRVMIDFIGGLIEGIGEGVGQVLIQSAARGRCHTRSDRTT